MREAPIWKFYCPKCYRVMESEYEGRGRTRVRVEMSREVDDLKVIRDVLAEQVAEKGYMCRHNVEVGPDRSCTACYRDSVKVLAKEHGRWLVEAVRSEQNHRAKMRELQFQVSRLLGRDASAGNTGKAFLHAVEQSTLNDVWSLLKDLA